MGYSIPVVFIRDAIIDAVSFIHSKANTAT